MNFAAMQAAHLQQRPASDSCEVWMDCARVEGQDMLSEENHNNSSFYCASGWHVGGRHQCDSLSNRFLVEEYPSPVHTVFQLLENIF